jgi:hypothetical protein
MEIETAALPIDTRVLEIASAHLRLQTREYDLHSCNRNCTGAMGIYTRANAIDMPALVTYTHANVIYMRAFVIYKRVNAVARAAEGLTWKHLQSTAVFLSLHWRIYKIHGCN